MPAPRWVARFNRSVTNRLTGPLAPWLPGFGVVIHTGRRSGTRYRTPVNVFGRPGGGFVMALTYGPDAEWVRNVLAGGGCALQTRGRTLSLSHPRLVHDPRQRAVPPPVRLVLGLMNVSDFLELDLESDAGRAAEERSESRAVGQR
jgi:deazaflavin-dependent oxidoreductase (nitroreductase family)